MLTLIITLPDESKPVRHDAKICTVASFFYGPGSVFFFFLSI